MPGTSYRPLYITSPPPTPTRMWGGDYSPGEGKFNKYPIFQEKNEKIENGLDCLYHLRVKVMYSVTIQGS